MKKNLLLILLIALLSITLFLLKRTSIKLSESDCELSALRNLNHVIHEDKINTYSQLHDYLSENYVISDVDLKTRNKNIIFRSKYCDMDYLEIHFDETGEIKYIARFKV